MILSQSSSSNCGGDGHVRPALLARLMYSATVGREQRNARLIFWLLSLPVRCILRISRIILMVNLSYGMDIFF